MKLRKEPCGCEWVWDERLQQNFLHIEKGCPVHDVPDDQLTADSTRS